MIFISAQHFCCKEVFPVMWTIRDVLALGRDSGSDPDLVSEIRREVEHGIKKGGKCPPFLVVINR
ncbi:hypothetical protein BOW52_05505 [Solemya elarraichensis gill symbiont]|uniref:Uncharacterized protein n=1 Tax=Solemya elarraichensis gill symbiont TaxID=1918949 RepID=A0A1T2L6L5_9GAMM|nr:hypothetical protein BOW52_05505 [Solemya elarraichensis gill symbiont]